MRWTVRLTAAAERDLVEARNWYQQEAPQVGPRFRQEVRRAQARIAENPFVYTVLHRDLRRVAIHRFPYALFYRIRDEDALVVAVIHHARHPRVWQHRR